VGTGRSGAGSGVLRLATRGSPLALRQAELVAQHLARVDPELEVATVVVRTRGDELAAVPLDRIGGQGAFVKEVQTAVLDGRADAAVHSAKDLPPLTPDGLVVAAVPERADPRDGLVGRCLADLVAGAVVATGSARRRAQLANLRPDLTFIELRGNMGTRLRRAEEGGLTVVVAVAALERLGWADRLSEVLPISYLLPQIGQGTLAVECRDDDEARRDLLTHIDDEVSRRTLTAERALLAALGASCSVPVAGFAEPLGGGRLRLQGLLASGDGRVLVREALEGDDPATLGVELAHHLLFDCGGSVIDEWAVDERAVQGSPERGGG